MDLTSELLSYVLDLTGKCDKCQNWIVRRLLRALVDVNELPAEDNVIAILQRGALWYKIIVHIHKILGRRHALLADLDRPLPQAPETLVHQYSATAERGVEARDIVVRNMNNERNVGARYTVQRGANGMHKTDLLQMLMQDVQDAK